jgi:pimeloyl-ACP methyl ester carboxylesterase
MNTPTIAANTNARNEPLPAATSATGAMMNTEDAGGAPTSPILPPAGGFMFQDRARFYRSFGADLAADAAYMADSQVPWGVDALTGQVTEPAWRSKPSWYLVATEDHMIPPSNQRAMAQRAGAKMVVEVAASNAVYWTHPGAVAALIRQARV